ncbi:MAG: serine/threonine protein kinase [Kiritimatiellia bacterium]|jgi:serine/threonine protein kinase
MPYNILSIEGSGAYGTVVKARDLQHRRRIVALKVLRQDHLDNPRVMCRTRDEARMMAVLSHPHIVKVYGLAEMHQRPFMIMEWLEAICLGDLIDTIGSGLPIEVACELIKQGSEALHHAYTSLQGDPPRPMALVHRDLKPNNMLVTIQGELKLVDFGLAHGDFDGKESDTVSMVLGTRAYMAPERLDGAEDHPSSDVYAMGLILYELLTGQPMSLSLNPRHHASKLSERMDALVLPDLPDQARRRLKALIVRMCAYEPEDRLEHLECASELVAVMAQGELAPDVHAFARNQVKPMVTQRRRVPPEHHKHWKDLQFLEKPEDKLRLSPARQDDPRRSAEVDEQIRKLLSAPKWANYLPRMRLLLETNAEWTETPFLEVLDAALEKRWMSRTQADPRKLAMCLNLLRQRMTQQVLQRVSALVTYEDELVSMTARQFLDHVRQQQAQ